MFFIDKFKRGIEKTKKALSEGINNAFKVFKRIDEELYEELEEILILSDISAINSEFVGFPLPVLIVYPKSASKVSILPLLHATSMA